MKPKINKINNVEDSIIITLESGNKTIDQLYNLFDIDDEVVGNTKNYIDLVGYFQYLDENDYIVYVLYLEAEIILIIRKTKNWEKKRDEIMEKFKFQKIK